MVEKKVKTMSNKIAEKCLKNVKKVVEKISEKEVGKWIKK